ncbi:MAG: hypothetical protein ACTSYB_01540 [Candidatus Helarchaeota archaeon]
MSNHRLKKEFTDHEKEWKFARWFWNYGEIRSWDAIKIYTTIFLSVFIALIGYVAISSVYTVPTATLVAIGLLLSIAILTNTDIRESIRKVLRRSSYDQVIEIESYKGINYYFLNSHDDVLFIENGRDLTAVGLFKLKAIPLVIQGNFERFIRSLYQQQIPLYWIYGQVPIDQGAILVSPAVSEEAREHYMEQSLTEREARLEAHGGMWGVRIIFGTRRSVPAIGNIDVKRIALYKQLTADLFKIQTAFTSAYPHTILEPLRGKELEKAFSITITGGGIPAFF